jgi:hypothetical protein
MNPVLLLILKQIAPVIIAPLATGLVKWLMGKFSASIPPAWQPVISAVAGAVAAGATGDVATAGSAAATAVSGAVAGIAGSKVRDIAVGKPRATAEPITVGKTALQD